jgi:amidophosphoribosyltransferase
MEGAFSLVLSDAVSLVGVRDPNGFRPLTLGQLPDNGGWVLSSEDSALKAIGATVSREVLPGEIVTITDGIVTSEFIDKEINEKQCAFEFIYFSRPDSNLAGRNVQDVRIEMGKQLALESPVDADVVIGVKDSGTLAAFGYGRESGISREEGLSKNPYSSRSFMQPDQAARERMVRAKHRPNPAVLKDQRVVLVDDSIVRGTTMRTLVQITREAGASEVHLRIPSPAYMYPCFYGMDTGDANTLLARQQPDIEAMRVYLGADSLAFLSTEGLEKAIAIGPGRLCLACMDGNYPTPIPEQPERELVS